MSMSIRTTRPLPPASDAAAAGAADGGQLTPLVYAARANDLESVKVLLDAGADVNQTTGYGWSPLLVATQNRYYKLAAYLIERGRERQPRQQGRLDAALPGHRQPQHRERRLSRPQAGHGSPGVHQAAARQGRQRQRPREGQHRDAHGLHQPVARRERRHGVPARVAVGRRRADEAAARARRRPEDRDAARRDAAARRRRHRLGRRHHLRVVAEGDASKR